MKSSARKEAAAERALIRVPGLTGARIAAQLSDGPTNTSFRVEHESSVYVMRLDKPGAVGLGLNRLNEDRVSRLLASAGLAPEPLFFDPAAGVSLRRYLEGRIWREADLEIPANLNRLSGVLSRLHALPPDGETFDPLTAAQRYNAQLNSDESRRAMDRLEKLAGRISTARFEPVLCHNDLVCQNILEGEKLILIDWEYAGVGDPFFDLAVVIRHHELSPRLARFFLEAYLGRSATSEERDRLQLQCEFYGYLLQLWNLRVAGM